MHKIWILSPLEQLFCFTNVVLFFPFYLPLLHELNLETLPTSPKNTL